MAAVTQPPTFSDQGLILTITTLCNGQRSQIVMPIATDDITASVATACEDVVEAWQSGTLQDELLAIMGSGAAITSVQAEGMVPGVFVPFRVDYPTATHTGTQGTVTVPNQVAALGVYYVDPIFTGIGNAVRVAKTFFNGLAKAEVTQDIISGAIETAVTIFVTHMASGFPAGTPASTWYRVGKIVRQTAQALPPIVLVAVRDYVVTQRRRLNPRP